MEEHKNKLQGRSRSRSILNTKFLNKDQGCGVMELPDDTATFLSDTFVSAA